MYKCTGLSILVSAMIAAVLTVGTVSAMDTDPARLLVSRNAEFKKDIIKKVFINFLC